MKRRKRLVVWCSVLVCILLVTAGCGWQNEIIQRAELFLTEQSEDELAEKKEGEQEEPPLLYGKPEAQSETAATEQESESGGAASVQEPVVGVSAGKYVYTTLDGECQRVYDEIYQTMCDHTESVRVSTLDAAVLDEAYKAVTSDYGGIFWVSGYVYTQYTKGGELIGLDFAPGYTMTQEERDALQGQIDEKAAEILGGVAADASDYQKVKYVFDYLASNVDYALEAEDNQNIISVFLHQRTVCQGYASATQYLLEQLGIQSAVVTGEANGLAHAWNLVRMDGEYYYVDTTWGNSTFDSEQRGEERFINYNYFGVTTEEISVTHTPNDYFVLPDCTAREDNYYIRENRYFSEWDPDAVGALCKAGYEAGNATVSVKFASRELYQQTEQYFIGEKHIADYCAGITSLYYVGDTSQNVLTFRFS